MFMFQRNHIFNFVSIRRMCLIGTKQQLCYQKKWKSGETLIKNKLKQKGEELKEWWKRWKSKGEFIVSAKDTYSILLLPAISRVFFNIPNLEYLQTSQLTSIVQRLMNSPGFPHLLDSPIKSCFSWKRQADNNDDHIPPFIYIGKIWVSFSNYPF